MRKLVIRYTISELKSIALLILIILGVNFTGWITRFIIHQDGVKESYAFLTLSEEGEGGVSDPQKDSIELNTADSLKLLDLYGIGPSFSSRIIKYRELLGGYYSIDQLLEVYGMDSVRWLGFIDRIWIDTACLRHINLTTVTFRDLLRHPYTDYEMVRSYMNYRDRHGPPASLESVYMGASWPDSSCRRIAPYLILKE